MAKKSMREQLGIKGITRKNLGVTRTPQNRKGIRIGADRETGRPINFDLGLFDTHLHCIGRTGTGKTRFLALLAQQILHHNIGGCIIDIQGGLYHLMENYIAHNPGLAERVVFLNPGEAQDPIVSFNPFQRQRYLPADHSLVDMAIEAIMKHNQETDQTLQTFKSTSTQIFSALVAGQQTILEAEYFCDEMTREQRDQLLAAVTQRRIFRFFKGMDRRRIADRDAYYLSFRNRLNKFLWYDMLRYTLGRTDHLLDFQDLVDNHKFLMVNLRYVKHLSFDAATLIGIFLIHQIFHYCESRHENEAKKHPFILMIDEMQNFITPDLVRILDQTRQKGLHLVLAHQRLQQLKDDDKQLYSALHSSAQTKVVFALPMDDAKLLADEIFDYDLQEIKHRLKTISVVDYRLEYLTAYHESQSKGLSKSEQLALTKGRSSTLGGSATMAQAQMAGQSGSLAGTHSHAAGQTWPTNYALGGSQHTVDAQAVMQSYGTMGSQALSQAETDIWADAEMEAETKSKAVTTSKTGTKGKSKVPVLIPVIGQQVTTETLYTLEDQRYRAAKKLQKHPNAGAVIKRINDPPIMAAIENVPDEPFDEKRIRKAHAISQKANPCYLSKLKTAKAIKRRHQALETAPPADEEEPIFKSTRKMKR